MKSDIEIVRGIVKKPINEVAKALNIDDEYLECYGKDKAKIDNKFFKEIAHKKDGKLILVTAINPTPMGEGKTTMSIGINDGLRRLGHNSLVVLREPSLGPVFGLKGGATGGGYSQVVPMEDINLHFTGDLHAITTTNNLLCAIIDNHIKQGNELNIDPERIVFKRCLDINDRALREVNIALGSKINGVSRKDHFVITVASEVMAVLCLAKDLEDFKKRISNILIGYNYDNNPIFVYDLKCEGALASLMKEAIKPNLVQTLEGNPALIHGGPFANIAHGCNSLIATKLALKLSDYVVTEAGFGSDLGAFKFLDIKCRKGAIKPDVIVIVTTVKALKYNGGLGKEELKKSNLNALEKGICNLTRHIANMQYCLDNVIVCLNKFDYDTEEEIAFIKKHCEGLSCAFEVSEAFSKGSEGAVDIAKTIVNIANNDTKLNLLYDLNDDIQDKISVVCREIFKASNVNYTEKALKSIENIIRINKDKLPICIAKTPYSFTDNPKELGAPKDFTMTVTDVALSSGAGFIVVLMGDVMTMPGLPKVPAAMNIDIDDCDQITGLF